MKKMFFMGLLFAVCLNVAADTKKLNQGFLKKAAKMVWEMDLPQFDPKKELTDSIFEGASAANIAVYYFFSADRHEMTTMRDGRIPPKEWRLGESEATFISRRMVKIQDERALEKHTQFSFEPAEIHRQQQVVLFDSNTAFGARIYKPDGRVIEVDMKETLTEGDGKKGKDAVVHKIAIPGLEVGDVLDYFHYMEYYFLGNGACSYQWNIMSEYPSASFEVNGRLDPSLTTVVSGYNGVEAPTSYNGNDLKRYLVWSSTDLPAFKEVVFTERARQFPTMLVEISDNISEVFPFAKSRRNPGVYFNPVAQTSLPGVAEHYAEIKIDGGDMGKATEIMKNYRAAHPDLTDSHIADAAFYATRYVTELSKHPYGWWEMTCFMKDLLDKQKIDSISYLGVTNPRNGYDIKSFTSYKKILPFISVAGKNYFFSLNTGYSPGNYSYAPGELPEKFGGEQTFKFTGKRKEIYDNMYFFMDKLPKETALGNSAVYNVNVTIDDPDDTSVSLNYDASRKGMFKSLVGMITSGVDLTDFIEEKLGLPKKITLTKDFKLIKSKRFDMKEIEDAQREVIEQMYMADLGIDKMTVDSLSINNFGFDVDNSAFTYSLFGTVEDVLAPAGDDLILNIGKLAQLVKVSNEERAEKEREISIFTNGPFNRRINLKVAVPEGYTVDEAAIKEIGKQVSGKTGVFMAQAKYDEGENTVNITLLHRNPSAIYHPSQWDEFRKLREEAAAFNEASIVFHRK